MITRIEEDTKIIYKFDIEDIDRDCWCYGNLYIKIGLYEDFLSNEHKSDANQIKTNWETDEIIKNKLRDNYKLVTLKGNKVIRYRKRKRSLTKLDEWSLGLDYLSYSPSIDNSLEDMVIVFEKEK